MKRPEYLRMISGLADQVPGVRDLIAPFGFEVLPGWDFERTRPVRAYVYVRLSPGASRAEVVAAIGDWLTTHAEQFPTTLETVALSLVSIDNRSLTTRVREEPGLAVFVYVVDADTEHLLDAYADYLALLPFAIAAGDLNEVRRFAEAPSARRFVFQAIRMLSTVHDEPLDASALETLSTAALRNGARELALPTRVLAPAAAEDSAAWDSAVVPAVDLLTTRLRGTTPVEWVDFHSNERRIYLADPEQVARARDRVITAYLTSGVTSNVG